MDKLISLYQKHPLVLEQNEGESTSISEYYTLSKTSFDAVNLCQISKKLKGKQIFFFNTEEDAKNFYQDLVLLNPDDEINLLEPSYLVKNKKLELVRHKQILRNRIIDNFMSKEDAILVCHPNSIQESILINTSSDLKREIIVRSELNLKDWINYLDSIEYERTSYVYEHGQYAIRGNILDIYSYAYSHPLRIELFDIEVEEIREFDIETQLSIQLRQDAIISPSPSFIARNKKTET